MDPPAYAHAPPDALTPQAATMGTLNSTSDEKNREQEFLLTQGVPNASEETPLVRNDTATGERTETDKHQMMEASSLSTMLPSPAVFAGHPATSPIDPFTTPTPGQKSGRRASAYLGHQTAAQGNAALGKMPTGGDPDGHFA